MDQLRAAFDAERKKAAEALRKDEEELDKKRIQTKSRLDKLEAELAAAADAEARRLPKAAEAARATADAIQAKRSRTM